MDSLENNTDSSTELEKPNTETSTVEPEKLSLREQIEHAAKETEPTATVVEKPKDGRDEKGRFASKEPVSDSNRTSPSTSNNVNAPASFKKEAKEAFSSLPPDIQAEVSRRMGETERARHEAATERNRLGELGQVFSPEIVSELALNQSTPAAFVRMMMAERQAIAKNPRQALRQMANTFGLTPEEIFSEKSVDPQISSLEQRISQFEQMMQQGQVQSEQSRAASAQSDIQNFASETDAQGNPVHPHVSELEDFMWPIAATVRQRNPQASNREVLEYSYRVALQAHPDLSESFVQSQVDRRIEEAKQKAQQAKTASRSITGAPNGAPASATPTTLRETLEAAASGQLA